jgi:phage/plasmid-like protein (TIGR03299 family)
MQSTAALRPWEKLGIPVTGRLTTGEALAITNNNWKVCKITQQTAPRLVYLKDEKTGEFALDALGCKIKDEAKCENSDLFAITNPQMCMTVREDTRSYLGTVGVGYKVVQNNEFCEFFDEALGKGAACINAVGTLGRWGARIFLVAQVPEMLEVVPGDPVERHILLTNTHDGTGNIEARFIAFRRQSNSMVHTPGEIVKIRHTKNAKIRLKTAHTILTKNQQYWERAKRAYAYMAKRNVDDARCRAFLEAMFPDIVEKDENGVEVDRRTSPQALKAREEIEALFKGDAPGAELAGETDWGLYNSVAYFVDHDRSRSKKQNEWKISRWEVSVFGPGANLRDRAYSWLRANK